VGGSDLWHVPAVFAAALGALGPEGFRVASTELDVASAADVHGGLLVARVCRPGDCDGDSAAVAVDLVEGRVYVCRAGAEGATWRGAGLPAAGVYAAGPCPAAAESASRALAAK
jgi:hypothetical protein